MKQCTYNVTLLRVRLIIVAMKTQRFLFIVAVGVAVNDIKVFNVAMEMQQWVTFALLSSY
jgi:hypothetical protein